MITVRINIPPTRPAIIAPLGSKNQNMNLYTLNKTKNDQMDVNTSSIFVIYIYFFL